MTRSRSRLVVLVVSLLAALGVVTAAPAAASPYCGITWGSQPKALHPYDPGHNLVSDVRVGQHARYDRLVVDIPEIAGFEAYHVRYVPEVTMDGSGATVPLRGAAALQVTIGATGYDDDGRPTYTPDRRYEAVDVTGFRTLRQVAWLGSFEGRSDIGVGTRARLPFRVFVLDGPGTRSRVVLDVAHRW